MLQIIENPVYLIELALFVFMLNSQLVAVCLSEDYVLIGPGVTDVADKIVNVAGLFLTDPKQLTDCGFKRGPAERQDGKFL